MTGFDNSGDSVGWSVDVPEGLYDLWIGYRSVFGEKGYDLTVGESAGSGMFEQSPSFAEEFGGQYFLDGGATDIDLLKGWGYYDVDYLELRGATPRTALPVTPTFSNPASTPRTRYLLKFLAEQYGQQTLYAQQRENGNPGDILSASYLNHTGGIFPAMIGSDLMRYSPSRVERGDNANGESERLIEWSQQTGGVVSLMWHWNAPSGLIDQPGNEWWRGFYTSATTFDLGAALADPGSEEYGLLIRDIDVIAAELQKFKEADIPVLWRPLHEAQGNDSGAWFWWGNSGPEALKELWGIMHDRMTNHHGLDNLLWVSTMQVDATNWENWYPGDDLVDLVGVDVYSTAGDNMSSQWLELLDVFDGEKLLALTESGTLPPEGVLEQNGVGWAYMMPWSEGFLTSNHSAEETQAILGQEDVIDLSELPVMPWRAAAALPGDFNGDGQVTMADHTVWRDHFGLTSASDGGASPADANGDGRVDAADYTIWRDAFESASQSSSVPSPGGITLLVVAVGLALRRRYPRCAGVLRR